MTTLNYTGKGINVADRNYSCSPADCRTILDEFTELSVITEDLPSRGGERIRQRDVSQNRRGRCYIASIEAGAREHTSRNVDSL